MYHIPVSIPMRASREGATRRDTAWAAVFGSLILRASTGVSRPACLGVLCYLSTRCVEQGVRVDVRADSGWDWGALVAQRGREGSHYDCIPSLSLGVKKGFILSKAPR